MSDDIISNSCDFITYPKHSRVPTKFLKDIMKHFSNGYGKDYPEGSRFESQHGILDGHISHIFVVKILMFVEKTKMNEKEAWMANFYKKSIEDTPSRI